ncbi:MAG: hypothetical protein WED05_08370 [Candidatus Atabeyarchaeum deiterrae]
MEKRNQPKARFSARLPSGEFLNLSVWQGKSDPKAEIIRVEIRGLSENQEWQSVARIAVYRTADGRYSQLPDRRPGDKVPSQSSVYEEPSQDL